MENNDKRNIDLEARKMILSVIDKSMSFGEPGSRLKEKAQESLEWLDRYIALEDESDRIINDAGNATDEEKQEKFEKLHGFVSEFSKNYPEAKENYKLAASEARKISEEIRYGKL